MNLHTLQYDDIARSIKSAIGAGLSGQYSTRIACDVHHPTRDYVFVERTRRSNYHKNSTSAPNCPDIKINAAPVFPNSLLSTEVGICVQSKNSVSTPQQTPKTIKHIGTSLDIPVENSLYYRLHDSVPDELGTRLYQEGAHVVGILQSKCSLTEANTALIHDLHSLLNPADGKQPDATGFALLFFLDNHVSRLSTPQNLHINPLRIELHTFSHLWHRLSVIGKSSLVLCDSAGVAVDSLRASVPVAFAKEAPAGYEALQACINAFLQHKNYQQLLDEQTAALEIITRSQNQFTYLMSNTDTVTELVQAHLSQPDLASSPYGLTPLDQGELCRLILSSQQLLPMKPDKSIRLLSGWETGRRKLQKFKESPSRFMSESQHRIVRSFVPDKTL